MKKTLTVLLILFIYSFVKGQELKLFKDLNPGHIGSEPRQFFQTDDHLFFLTDNVNSLMHPTLWKSNGKDFTDPLLDISAQGYHPDIVAIKGNGKTAFFFYSDYETPSTLFFTDGTSNGTNRLKVITNHFSSSGGNTSILHNGKLYFSGSDSVYNMYLWVSDGTKTGTKPLKFFTSKGTPKPFRFLEFNGIVYFSGNNELWKTDGTETGTVMINDFLPEGNIFGEIVGLFKNNLIILVQHRTYGYELWKSDGTLKGSKLIKDINQDKATMWTGNSHPQSFIVFNNKMFFTAEDGIHGREIWTSDGTEAGTQLLMDINKSDVYYYKYPSEFHATNDMLYFNGFDELNGYQLWKTDGTEAGTKMVKKIINDKDKYPKKFVSIGNTLFFVADNGNGEEVYMTDGTEDGTKILEPKNRTETKPFSTSNSQKNPLFVFKEKLFVSGDYEADYGSELYIYDPKPSTSGIRSINNLASSIYPNPAQNEIKIKNNSFSKVEIYDINGKLLIQSTNTKESIDISSIPSGVYIVKMGNDKTQITERLIKN